MLLCMFVGAVNAEVTKYYKPGERLSTLTEGQKVMFYNTCLPDDQDRTGFLIDNAGNFALNKQKPSAAPIFSEKVGVWTLENVTLTDGAYTVNVKGANGYVGIGGKTNNGSAQVLRFQEQTVADASKKAGVNSENAAGTKVNNADISAEDNVWLVTNADQSNTWNGNQASFATWSTGHPYAVYSVVEATTADLEAMLATAKTAAVNELNSLKQLSAIYTTAESAIASVNNVALENDDLETALNAIDAWVAQTKLSANGKNVKFCNKSTDGRGGNYLGYDKTNNRAAAVADGGDAAIWTIKTNADGTFKLYNWVNNHYLGAPADPTPVVAAEVDAPSFKFIVTAENEVAIATGDKMVHIANHSNYKVINYWSTTDKASLWTVTVVPEIVVTHEQYNAALAAQSTLPYAVQQAYGLVTDAANYYSNYKSTAEGSYEALLDNVTDSYFHSAYGSEPGDGSGVHYIQATLAEGVDQFYFYMLPRSQNGNNRPKNITVSGSNDGTEFTKICDVTTTLDGSMNPYLSAKLGTVGTTYKYIRLTVTSTNTSSTFFTLSELYFLPANADVTNLVNAYKNFASSSITSAEMATAATALINAETVLALSNIKKEVAALLTANATNHAETPALGQYSTAAYNTLQAAYNDASATQESLENAIVAFKKAKNLPVFMITGPKDYVVGKSIYDDPTRVNAKGNTLYFKTTNIYDKAMWWAMDITEREVGATHLNKAITLYNVGTGNDFWNSTIKLTETNENDGAGIADDDIFLMYTTNNASYPVHFQSDDALMTRWGSYEATSASAMKFVYVGNSYDLKQLPEALFTAAAELAAINVNYTFSEGVNNYNPAGKPALDAAIANRTTVLSNLSSAEALATAKATLEAAIDAIELNMPVDGKFYRVRCTASGMKYLQYTQNTNANRFDMISGDAGKTVNATFCYTDGGLVSYVKPMYINHDSNVASMKMEITTVTFSEATGVTGQYFVNVGGRYLYGDGDNSDSGSGTNANAGYRWWLEEVTSLPVTISAAGYASFYAPVAVELPDGLTAYYVSATANGWATLTEIDGTVPANTGVLLAGEANTYELTIADAVDAIEGNKLAGSVASEYVTTESYVLSAKEGVAGFYKAAMNQQEGASFLNNGFKAYLPVGEAQANVLRFNFGGNETAIESVESENGVANTEIFDLAGRRVAKAQKGLYIVNGKKVIK